MFPFRNGQFQFLDKGGDVIVGNNSTFPFLDAEDLFRQLDGHVLTYRHLTSQPFTFTGFAFAQVVHFCWQYIAATGKNLAAALTAGTTATTGGGNENAIGCQRTQ